MGDLDRLIWTRRVARQFPGDGGFPKQKPALVQLLSPQPAGHLEIALAGIAGPAGGHDVVERVSSAARDGLHTVFLQVCVVSLAIGTATPNLLQRSPLLGREVMVDLRHATLATSGVHRGAAASWHPASLRPHAGSVAQAGPQLICGVAQRDELLSDAGR